MVAVAFQVNKPDIRQQGQLVKVLFEVSQVGAVAVRERGLVLKIFLVLIQQFAKRGLVILFYSKYRFSAIRLTRLPSSASASFFFLKDCRTRFPLGSK